MRLNLTKADFLEALHLLDDELDSVGFSGVVQIRASGGFALLWNGLRKEGYTSDIDTITPTYQPEVESAIERVASRLDLPPDWINNDPVYAAGPVTTDDDVAFYDLESKAVYESSGITFRHIDLSVADLETLAWSKAHAVADIGRGRTSRDLGDLLAILAALGFHDSESVVRSLPWMNDPECAPARREIEKRMQKVRKTQDEFER